jgi:hypothetical protein
VQPRQYKEQMKIGRNEPCPCHSGKKYKQCCGRNRTDAIIPPEVLNLFARHAADEQRHRERYGQVRRPRTVVGGEWRFISVGGKELVRIPRKTTFHGFLFKHLYSVLGAGWIERELKKEWDSHPLAEWAEAERRIRATISDDATEPVEVVPNGTLKAFITLAYDLYVVADNEQLLRRLVKRLREPRQFQGARYELAVTATLLRAGFDIAHEDERDSSRRHPEFIAKHRATGEEVAVEAKSKHRAGVLGFRDPKATAADLRLGIGALLRDAAGKVKDRPYIVFVDLNLPPGSAHEADIAEWKDEILELLQRVNVETVDGEERTITNLLLLTNFPHHYSAGDAPAPDGVIHHVRSVLPRNPMRSPELLDKIIAATRLYGNVPVHWPDE